MPHFSTLLFAKIDARSECPLDPLDDHLIFQSKDKIVAPVVFSDANFGFVLLGDDGAARGS